MTQHKTELLSEDGCWSRVSNGSVGRFVYLEGGGPAAIPVNYARLAKEIVFRVGQGSSLRGVLAQPVAFDLDDFDPDGSGWSVLVRGEAREIDVDNVPAMVREMEVIPQPLVQGVHNVWIALTPNQVTGRKLGDPV